MLQPIITDHTYVTGVQGLDPFETNLLTIDGNIYRNLDLKLNYRSNMFKFENKTILQRIRTLIWTMRLENKLFQHRYLCLKELIPM